MVVLLLNAMDSDVIVSAQFKDALKRHPWPAYRLWRRHDVDPTTGSKLLNGAVVVLPNDPRIIAVGRDLGLTPAECFESEDPGKASAGDQRSAAAVQGPAA